jgi:hypothetical protein
MNSKRGRKVNVNKAVTVLLAVLGGLAVQAKTIYQDDFSGAAGAATATVPETVPDGFVQHQFGAGLDGSGGLIATEKVPYANFRVNLGPALLTADASVRNVKCTVVLRPPALSWVGIGFHEQDVNALLGPNNSGPFVLFAPDQITLCGGAALNSNGNTSALPAVYKRGAVITAEIVYHSADQTLDMAIDGTNVVSGFVLGHKYPKDIPSAPVLQWIQIQFFNQPSAADGGPFVDSLKMEIF